MNESHLEIKVSVQSLEPPSGKSLDLSSHIQKEDSKAESIKVTAAFPTNSEKSLSPVGANMTNQITKMNKPKHRNFLTIYRRGRLGNMMFQYAAGLGISRRLNRTFIMDKDKFNQLAPVHLQNIFKISHLGRIPGGFHWEMFTEFKPSKYDNRCESLPDDVDLMIVGYFQSYKYFQNIDAEIRQEYIFLDHIQKQAEDLLMRTLPPGTATVTVGIHVRRGDKVTYPGLVQPTSYFRKAMEHMRQQHGNVTFLVATDDRDWATSTDLLAGSDVIVLEEASGEVSVIPLYM